MARLLHWSTAVAVMIIGALGYLLQREHAEVILLRAEATKYTADHAQLTSLQKKSAATRPAIVPENRTDTTSAATPKPSPEGKQTLSDTGRQIRARLLQNRMQHERWMKLSKDADVIAGLNLPPDTVARFKDLLVERAHAEADAKEAASKAGIAPATSEETEAIFEAVGKVTEQIKALLGEAEFQKYAELVGAKVVWETSIAKDLIGGYFVDSGVPLSPEQTAALARAFYQETRARAQSGSVQWGDPDPATGLNPSQTMLLEQASQALSPLQLETLRNFFHNDNQNGELMKAFQAEVARTNR